MVTGDKHKLFGIGGLPHNLFQRFVRAKLVVVAADEQLGLRTLPEKRKRVEPAIGGNRRSQRYQGTDVGIRTAGLESVAAPKENPAKDDGQRELLLQPCQRGLHIADLATPVIVLACAQPRPPEIEAQDRKAKGVQRLHGMEDDLVVHRPAKHGMWMANQTRVRGGRRAHVKQGFQTPRRAVEKKRPDCRVRVCQPPPASRRGPPSSLHHMVERPNALAHRISRFDRLSHVVLGRLDSLRQILPQRQLAG